MSITTDVAALLADLLDLTPPVDWSQIHYQETDAWDSLVQMALVGDLEDRYGIALDEDDIMAMEDLPAILAVLRAHGVLAE